MPKVKDILGNEGIIADEAITISIDRYNELIVKEAKYDSGVCNHTSNIVRFYIKGTCVDDLFHILESNGYPVQMSTIQDDTNTYRVDVMMNNEESEEE